MDNTLSSETLVVNKNNQNSGSVYFEKHSFFINTWILQFHVEICAEAVLDSSGSWDPSVF